MNDSRTIRPLIIGAGGLVGRALTDRFEELYPDTVSTTRVELDITDRWRIEAELERLEPTVVINTAAQADVDGCERQPELALKVNGLGPGYLAQACRNARIRLIHLSTDYVFDGETAGEYDEADPPNPINTYAKTKLAGEEAVLNLLADAVVLRISFLFGPGRTTFLDKIATAARDTKESIPCVDSWVTKPTYVPDIVSALERIVRSDLTGLIHFANGPAVSRYQFARRVVELVGADPQRVKPISPASLSLPARRPPRTPLSTRRYCAQFRAEPRSWDALAADYLASRS